MNEKFILDSTENWPRSRQEKLMKKLKEKYKIVIHKKKDFKGA